MLNIPEVNVIIGINHFFGAIEKFNKAADHSKLLHASTCNAPPEEYETCS